MIRCAFWQTGFPLNIFERKKGGTKSNRRGNPKKYLWRRCQGTKLLVEFSSVCSIALILFFQFFDSFD